METVDARGYVAIFAYKFGENRNVREFSRRSYAGLARFFQKQQREKDFGSWEALVEFVIFVIFSQIFVQKICI